MLREAHCAAQLLNNAAKVRGLLHVVKLHTSKGMEARGWWVQLWVADVALVDHPAVAIYQANLHFMFKRHSPQNG